MTPEEYLSKKKDLKAEFELAELNLIKQFVSENNPHKIGDKVTDNVGSILIERIGFSWGFSGIPCATYTGVELNKNGSPNKRGNKRIIYQSSLITNLNKSGN